MIFYRIFQFVLIGTIESPETTKGKIGIYYFFCR